MFAPNRCTCPPRPRGPPWDDGADDGPCEWCEDAPYRDLTEAHADGECPNPEEMEEA
jgi:hypothetical protein